MALTSKAEYVCQSTSDMRTTPHHFDRSKLGKPVVYLHAGDREAVIDGQVNSFMRQFAVSGSANRHPVSSVRFFTGANSPDSFQISATS